MRCINQAGSCLRNQLEDLQNLDEARLQRGEIPLYRATAVGTFAPYADAAGSQYVASCEGGWAAWPAVRAGPAKSTR